MRTIVEAPWSCFIRSISICARISLEPSQYSLQPVGSVAWLRDGVAFVGVNHKLRLHAGAQQGLMKGLAHR